jgi:hypothetical protein
VFEISYRLIILYNFPGECHPVLFVLIISRVKGSRIRGYFGVFLDFILQDDNSEFKFMPASSLMCSFVSFIQKSNLA